jgi:hypothetical protein
VDRKGRFGVGSSIRSNAVSPTTLIAVVGVAGDWPSGPS